MNGTSRQNPIKKLRFNRTYVRIFYGFAVTGLLFKSAGRLVVTCALFLRGLRPPGRPEPCTLRRGLALPPPGAVCHLNATAPKSHSRPFGSLSPASLLRKTLARVLRSVPAPRRMGAPLCSGQIAKPAFCKQWGLRFVASAVPGWQCAKFAPRDKQGRLDGTARTGPRNMVGILGYVKGTASRLGRPCP